VIASCGVLGLDWRDVGAGEFAEAVEAHNAASSGPSRDAEPASPEFRAFMRAKFKRD
jgi:hypothetical protein